MSRICESAGTGRQARLRGVCQPTCGFKSHLSHQNEGASERMPLHFGIRGNFKCSGQRSRPCAVSPHSRRDPEGSYVEAKSALLRRFFMPLAQKAPCARSLASPFQNRTRCAGLRFCFLCEDAPSFWHPSISFDMHSIFPRRLAGFFYFGILTPGISNLVTKM